MHLPPFTIFPCFAHDMFLLFLCETVNTQGVLVDIYTVPERVIVARILIVRICQCGGNIADIDGAIAVIVLAL